MRSIMSKFGPLAMFEFTVSWVGIDGLERETATAKAAYFQEQDAMILFKDSEHAVVDAFKTDVVLRVKRAESPVVDAV